MARRQDTWRAGQDVRSKNAGVDKITFDIIFPDRATYERVKRSRVLTRATVAALYSIPDVAHRRFRGIRSGQCDQVHHLPQRRRAAARATRTFLAAQQYAPLLGIMVPEAIAS